ncbi:DUF1772 domain-containing protein [Sphingomonas oligophenolica]|uniref:DUF1772 domain-containing protein n=1 Tax=Sphingomonas oligophenolica TaxID=301154 RepID=A0ABU9Y6P3_9SPHN
MIGLYALVAAALFSGAALYISFAEQPARLKLDDRALLTEWRSAYRRGTLMQAPLAILGAVLGAGMWWEHGGWFFLAGAVLMMANLPWTFVVIMPVNSQLGRIGPEDDPATIRPLVRRWARLHAGRTAFGLLATAAFVLALSPVPLAV